MKRYLLPFAMAFISLTVFSQQYDPVLININGKEITRTEFLSRYNKEGQGVPLKSFLDKFIDDKLKIAEVKSLGVDTTAAFLSQLNAYHKNSSKSYFLNAVAADALQINSKSRNKQNKDLYVVGLHIYKYLPQNTPARQVNKVEQQMDSLHKAIRNNPSVDFSKWVNNYSDDKDTFCICKLEMPEEFEKVVFNLDKDEVSKPFFTPQGIHIVKVLDKKSGLPAKDLASGLRLKNINDEAFLNRIKTESNYVPNQEAFNELRAKGKTDKTLFTIDGNSYTGNDFAYFSMDNTKNLQTRINDFVRKSLYAYENNKLNADHSGFQVSEQEYRDRILMEYIDRRMAAKAQNDNELQDYFNAHKKQYRWDLPRYKGIVIHTKDKKTRKRIKKQLKKVPETQRLDYLERTYNFQSTNEIKAEQGTFAVADNAFVDKRICKVGAFTPIETHPFTLLMGDKVKGQESYEEIRDEVRNDYKNCLEERWISLLRKKSKVEIKQEVLKTVNNH